MQTDDEDYVVMQVRMDGTVREQPLKQTIMAVIDHANASSEISGSFDVDGITGSWEVDTPIDDREVMVDLTMPLNKPAENNPTFATHH